MHLTGTGPSDVGHSQSRPADDAVIANRVALAAGLSWTWMHRLGHCVDAEGWALLAARSLFFGGQSAGGFTWHAKIRAYCWLA